MEKKTAFEQDLSAILHHGEPQPLARASSLRAYKFIVPVALFAVVAMGIGALMLARQPVDRSVAQAPAASAPVARSSPVAQRPIPSAVDLAVHDLQPSSVADDAVPTARAPRRRINTQREKARATGQRGRPVAYQPTAALAITPPRDEKQNWEGTNDNDKQREIRDAIRARENERLARLEALDAVRSLRLR
jgi:hypothetical protein